MADRIGDQPIEPAYREAMKPLAKSVDLGLNGPHPMPRMADDLVKEIEELARWMREDVPFTVEASTRIDRDDQLGTARQRRLSRGLFCLRLSISTHPGGQVDG